MLLSAHTPLILELGRIEEWKLKLGGFQAQQHSPL
jgi:hypothetical protein